MTAEEKTAPRKRVVIAEDEALIRMDLAEMLQEECEEQAQTSFLPLAGCRRFRA